MSGVRRKLLPINGGPGSILPTKFGNEELGGKFGRGFSRLAVALAPPFSEAFNANGGVRDSKKQITAEQGRVGEMPNPPQKNKNPRTRGYPPTRQRRAGQGL